MNKERSKERVLRPPPGKLYKYRALPDPGTAEEGWRRREVADTRLYFSSPQQLNDLFECRPAFLLDASEAEIEVAPHVGAKTYRERQGRSPTRKKAEVRRRLRDPRCLRESWWEMVNRFGFYCLSEACDHPLLWAHYGDSHRGYCLEFSTKGEAWNPEFTPFPVVYSPTPPSISNRDLMRSPRDLEEPWDAEAMDWALALLAGVRTKHLDWSYEKEWRMMRLLRHGGFGTEAFATQVVSGVIIGARMQRSDEMRLREWVAESGRSVSWYRAGQDRDHYRMTIVEAS